MAIIEAEDSEWNIDAENKDRGRVDDDGRPTSDQRSAAQRMFRKGRDVAKIN